MTKKFTLFISCAIASMVALAQSHFYVWQGDAAYEYSVMGTDSIGFVAPKAAEQSFTLGGSTFLVISEGDMAKMQLSAVPTPQNDEVEWTSSDKSIVEVIDGIIVGRSAGMANIVAKCGDRRAQRGVLVKKGASASKSDTVYVEKRDTIVVEKTETIVEEKIDTIVVEKIVEKVVEKKDTIEKVVTETVTVAPQSITLNSKKLSMTAYEMVQIVATVLPAECTRGEIVWSSSDEAVATVMAGVVIAKGAGNCVITASLGDIKATADLEVVAKPVAVESVTITSGDIEVQPGKTGVKLSTIGVKVSPADATYGDIEWSVEDETVAKIQTLAGVDYLVGVGSGTTYLVATIDGKTAKVKVMSIVQLKSIAVNPTEITAARGSKINLSSITVTLNPANAINQEVEWASSDASIAAISGSEVSFVKAGKTTLVVSQGAIKASVNVTVIVKAESIEMNKSVDVIVGGKGVNLSTLNATVSPSDATNKTIEWSVSDPTALSITNGIMTASKAGTYTLTATCGEAKATATVNAIVPVSSINIKQDTLRLTKGDDAVGSATIDVEILPANATNKQISWRTTNASVITATETAGAYLFNPVGGGRALLIASQGLIADTLVVDVAVNATSFDIDTKSIDLTLGGQDIAASSLGVTILPTDATNADIKWTSLDSSVVDIVVMPLTGDVYFRAISGGETSLIAQMQGFTVEVEAEVIVPTTAVSVYEKEITLVKGGDPMYSTQLTATVEPASATNQMIEWRSTNTDVVKVTNLSGTYAFTAVGSGSALLIASQGSYSDTVKVNILVPVDKLVYDTEEISMAKGSSISIATVTPTILPADATDRKISYSTTDNDLIGISINSVSSLVLAKAVGEATLTASCGGKSASVKISIYQPLKSIAAQQPNVDVKIGNKVSLSELGITFTPADASYTDLTWTSSDTKVAIVDDEAITAVSAGECNIIGTSKEGKTITISVNAYEAIAGVDIAKKSLMLAVGETYNLSDFGASENPEPAEESTFTWSSSDETVVRIVGDKIEAVGLGSATITVTNKGGNSASSSVSVIVPLKSITSSITAVEMAVGEKTTPIITFDPINATYQQITWSSTNDDVAEMQSDGSIVAKGEGVATLTGTTAEGKQVSITVTAIIPVESVSFEVSSIDLYLTQKFDISLLKPTVTPANATYASDLTFTVDDEAIASMSGTKVRGNDAGVATITATCSGKTAQAQVNVIDRITYQSGNAAFTMIIVDGGTFMMGAQNTDPSAANYDQDASSYEAPVHQVTLSPYMIGETEVTQLVYYNAVGKYPTYGLVYQMHKGESNYPINNLWGSLATDLPGKLTAKVNAGVTFALPTEAQWEYAARGGKKSKGYKYSGSNDYTAVASTGKDMSPVKSKAPNELGIYDMSGNEAEWVAQTKANYTASSQVDPAGTSLGSSAIMRGGNYEDGATKLRVSDRQNYSTTNTANFANYKRGVRLAAPLPFPAEKTSVK